MTKKITDLTAASALGGTELFEVVQSSTSKKTTPAAVKTYVLTGPLTTVVHASPVGGGFVTQFMFDDTATTGGLYAWTGSDYTQIGLATT